MFSSKLSHCLFLSDSGSNSSLSRRLGFSLKISKPRFSLNSNPRFIVTQILNSYYLSAFLSAIFYFLLSWLQIPKRISLLVCAISFSRFDNNNQNSNNDVIAIVVGLFFPSGENSTQFIDLFSLVFLTGGIEKKNGFLP